MGCRQSGTETFRNVYQRVDADKCLQPRKTSDLDGREGCPRVIGSAEESYRKNNESEHQAYVTRRNSSSQE